MLTSLLNVLHKSRDTYHVVGVHRLDEGRKHVDPVLDGLVVSPALARLIQEVPCKDGGVLFVQLPIVCVAPASCTR